MSLFLGNLSAHIQQEDLEHVFRRFGRCSVRMKDGYGFVVFEEPFNAEKALRALRGKLICGEQINLSWSNKQPRNFHIVARNNKFYEPYRRRNFRDGDVNFNTGNDRRDFTRHQGNQRAFRMTNFDVRETGHRQRSDFVGDVEGQKSSEKASAAQEYNRDEDGRWGEPNSNVLDDNSMGNGADFERYEPNRDYDGKDFDGNATSGSYSSPDHARSPEKRENSDDAQLKHLDNLRQQPVCYNCGLLGHIMRNCPRGGSSRIEKSSRFYQRKIRVKDEVRRGELETSRKFFETRREAGKDALYYEHHGTGSEFRHKDNKRFLKGRHRFTDVDDTSRSKKREADALRKKKGKLDQGSLKKQVKKRKRHPSVSCDTDSKGTSSPSDSVSTGSDTKTTSRSNSKSASSKPSKSHMHSSESRSASVSSRSKSRDHRSRSSLRSVSRTRSRSRSRMSIPESLSVSLDKKSVSSEQKVCASDSDVPLFDGQHIDASPEPGNLLENIQIPERELALDVAAAGISNELDDALGDKHQDVQLEEHIFYENDDVLAVKDVDVPILENLSGIKDKSDNDIAKPDMESFGALDLPNSMGLSTQEMVTVLSHYGLEVPKNFENELTVGTFFGAVRFWPWELIYYRRLKKGPISTENYARRLQQNKEFGIVDKYIRSSSGWGVCSEKDL